MESLSIPEFIVSFLYPKKNFDIKFQTTESVDFQQNDNT